MPCDNYMVVSKLIFTYAAEDIPNFDAIKTLIKDIFDIRQAKLRKAIDTILTADNLEGSHGVSFNNITPLEIETIRPFLPYASDLVARLERVHQQHTSNLSDSLLHQLSHFTSSIH